MPKKLDNNITTKVCAKCGLELPIENFYKTKLRADGTRGYQSYCRSCHHKISHIARDAKLGSPEALSNFSERAMLLAENKEPERMDQLEDIPVKRLGDICEDLASTLRDGFKLENTDAAKLQAKYNLTLAHIYELVNFVNSQKSVKGGIIDYCEKVIKILFFTDLHAGHLNCRKDILAMAAEAAYTEKVDMVLDGGDTLEGMSGRPGHIFELERIGYDAQCSLAAELLNQFPIPVHSIESMGSHTGWFFTKFNMGADAPADLMRRTEKYKFLGWDEHDMEFSNGLIIRLVHPGGGTAYAISYQPQNYIRSLAGGTKPHVVLMGHYHKQEHIFTRNIHCCQGGCLENQTAFMRKKNAEAVLGYYIITIHFDKKHGITRFLPEFRPGYEGRRVTYFNFGGK